MQIVINVENELYEYFSVHRSMQDDGYFSHVGQLMKALRDGNSLPEGHGRIVDERKITKCEQVGIVIKDGSVIRCIKTDAPTIIEADKESEE